MVAADIVDEAETVHSSSFALAKACLAGLAANSYTADAEKGPLEMQIAPKAASDLLRLIVQVLAGGQPVAEVHARL